MLVCIAGFPGSGRKKLAEYLAAHHGFYFYDMSTHHLRRRWFNSKGQVSERTLYPETDTERFQILERASKEFPMLSKMHENVVIEVGFYRREPREFLLAKAKASFKNVIVVWVDSTEGSAREQIARSGAAQGVQDWALKRRERTQEQFEPFDIEPPHIQGDRSIEEVGPELWSVIQTKLAKI